MFSNETTADNYTERQRALIEPEKVTKIKIKTVDKKILDDKHDKDLIT